MGIDIYTAVALQNEIHVVEERVDIQKNLDRVLKMIDYAPQSAIAAQGSYERSWAPIKLISAPEFFIQGHDGGWRYDHYIKNVCVDLPGPEIEQLANKCKEYKIFFAGCVLERDHEFTDYKDTLIWNTHFIIDPKGEIIHKYRKLIPAIHYELSISPRDIKDRYAEIYGGDNLSTWFPVTDTEIGKLGTITCMDGNFPEPARALGIQGVEVMMHPLFAAPLLTRPTDIWEPLNRTRAWENCCYLIGASWGEIHGNRYKTFTPGQAMIVDYSGVVKAIADYPGEGLVTATINLEELRRRRLDPSRNFLTQLPADVFGLIYEKEVYPANMFLEKVPMTREERESASVIKKFIDEGIFNLPEKVPEWFD